MAKESLRDLPTVVMVYHTGTQAQNMALFGRHKLWKIRGGGILHLAQDVDVVVVYDAELRRHILRLIFGQVYTKSIFPSPILAGTTSSPPALAKASHALSFTCQLSSTDS